MAVPESIDGARLRSYSSRLTSLSASFAEVGSRIWSTAKAVLRALQIARMKSVLSQLDDAQLAQIGISRSEVSQYAKTLMAEK